MIQNQEFPLVSGHLSLDLVNTEVVRRGIRYDLLVTSQDLVRWIHTMEQVGSLVPPVLPKGYSSTEALEVLREVRDVLRKEFERIADGNKPKASWRKYLEKLVERAPLSYKIVNNSLIPIPVGRPAEALASLVALDSLHLLATGDLLTLRRCANPDCVLLFIDASGRRKWCSMKICGNRTKVARHLAKRRS